MPSYHLGLLLGGEQEALPQAQRGAGGRGGESGKRCRKVEKASGKGVSETAALGAGALEQTREVGGGRGAACSRQANLGYTSDCPRFTAGPAASTSLALDSGTETLP